MLDWYRVNREAKKATKQLMRQAEQDGRLSGEAIDRRVPVLERYAERIQGSPVDFYFQSCLQSLDGAAFDCLVKLPHLVAAGTTPDNPQWDLYTVLQRMAQDDDVFWPVWSLVRWGYVCEFAALNWPERYDEAIELATTALPSPSERELEVIEYGPLVSERQDEAERFEMRLVRHASELLPAEFGELESSELVFKLLPYWSPARDEGWTFFNEMLNELAPDGPPEMA